MHITQDATTDALDHRPVPAHEDLERHLIPFGEEAFQELPIALTAFTPQAGGSA
jgi:hypothetical protein